MSNETRARKLKEVLQVSLKPLLENQKPYTRLLVEEALESLEIKTAANPSAALDWVIFIRNQTNLIIEGWDKYDSDSG